MSATRQQRPPTQIDRTKLPQNKIKDLSTLSVRVTHLGSDWDRTHRGPWDHEAGRSDVQKSTHKQVRTRAHIWSKDDKEVLMHGAIPKDCIVEIGRLRRRAAGGGGGGACKKKAGTKAKSTTASAKAGIMTGASSKTKNALASKAGGKIWEKRGGNNQIVYNSAIQTIFLLYSAYAPILTEPIGVTTPNTNWLSTHATSAALTPLQSFHRHASSGFKSTSHCQGPGK
ncbi:hypothetical protein DFJ73DRAFT_765968 [Zopfochytrium polystomum]|nr:hypothetical protein DFJ73DRAFT_765968 [Zopfochytrium polystomum]